MAAPSLPVMCYDLRTISTFFRSCAVVMSLQQTTHIEWTTYRDSKVLNAIYATLFWKEPPGFAEVRMGTRTDIDRFRVIVTESGAVALALWKSEYGLDDSLLGLIAAFGPNAIAAGALAMP